MKPNLFRWATSELSQDAFICWLVEWAKPQYKNDLIHGVACMLLRKLSNVEIGDIQELEIKKQYKHIDILIIVNNKIVILIEDKVNAINHSNQLDRYAEVIEKEFKRENVSLIYFKTGDQSNYKTIYDKGYKVFKRFDFISLLKQGQEKGIKSEIYINYLNFLQNKESSVNSFKETPIDKWHNDSWVGFYMKIQQELGEGEWSYVANPAGGFLGFWWHWKNSSIENNKFDYYLQLEQHKLVFKLYSYNDASRKEIRESFRKILFEKAKQLNVSIKQFGRIGKWMSTAILEYEYRAKNEKDILDMANTIENLKEIMHLLDEVEKEITTD